MNSISDRKIIDKLSEASNRGVKIDMMVRGITCILPGVEGRTENIEICQVVGRFLEHHRVYQFGRGNAGKIYISSADFMTRNIRNRMEVAVPIYDDEIKNRILEFMDIMFSDDVKMRKLQKDGSYAKVTNVKGINAQEVLIRNAISRSTLEKESLSSSERYSLNKTSDKKEIEDSIQTEKIENRSLIQKIMDFFRK